ncbi:MAG: bacteriochlorophyll 4-vinyl reductase [Maricaulaceae bacterium]
MDIIADPAGYAPAPARDAMAGVVGPNAAIQLAQALEARFGAHRARAVFQAAGFGALFDHPPRAMMDERIAAALFNTVERLFPPRQAQAILTDAGRRTGAYILAHRIPGFAQAILKRLPRRWAARALLTAIRKSAWTFAGSGLCRVRSGGVILIDILANPIPSPDCAWHRGVFETLFRALISPQTRVEHEDCVRNGAPLCRFVITFGGSPTLSPVSAL